MLDYPDRVKAPLKSVAISFYMSKITGEYWENQMVIQAKKIADLPETERISFFKGIILITCDLDTSRATVFIERLADDAEALHAELLRIKLDKAEISRLSKKQQQEVISWVEGLTVVIQQQKNKSNRDSRIGIPGTSK